MVRVLSYLIFCFDPAAAVDHCLVGITADGDMASPSRREGGLSCAREEGVGWATGVSGDTGIVLPADVEVADGAFRVNVDGERIVVAGKKRRVGRVGGDHSLRAGERGCDGVGRRSSCSRKGNC